MLHLQPLYRETAVKPLFALVGAAAVQDCPLNLL